jgi:hypothetical protein
MPEGSGFPKIMALKAGEVKGSRYFGNTMAQGVLQNMMHFF